ncbi:hypothetical protein BD408DRAFT_425492 [Parasitella parasitica]|nr:hypothetical protein BD408DRAFT_425492 [Parasitella parasitica]
MHAEQGNRVKYDCNTLLALAGSPFSNIVPSKMVFIAGVTKTPNQSDVVRYFAKTNKVEKKKEKKKTGNPFELLGDE